MFFCFICQKDEFILFDIHYFFFIGAFGSYLQLEENIRIIALSGDWVKLVDNWLVEAFVTQSATSTTGSTQKRGPGRRSKRQSVVSEIADDSCVDKDFTRWQGGKLSKHIFQRGVLPRLTVRRAARQGSIKVSILSEEIDYFGF